jgi:hypothetical protein
MHTPRHIQTSIELSELVAVPHQIVSAQSNKPVIGCIQDNLLGCMKITQNGVVISREDLLDILGYIHNDLPDVPYKEEYTGKEVFSFFIPHSLNYTNGDVVISHGQLIEGELSKKHMGTASGGLIHVIWNDYGAHETVKFMDNISILVNRWLMTQGFSVGLSDAIVDIKTKSEINTVIEDTKLKVYQEIAKVDNGTTDTASSVVFEHDVLNLLNATRDNVGSLATKNVFHNNRIKDMVTAGSKGSPLNISQIMGLVGQQVVKNADGTMGRVADGFTDRPFPHVAKYTLEPSARGFVGNSYLTGLEPLEWFCHSMSGREGLIDTAVKSVTGDTELIIKENGMMKRVCIGEWVDTHLEQNKEQIKHHTPEEANMELLKLQGETLIQSTDNHGNMSWEKITHITRHDPSEYITIIKTKHGREVKVVDSKSLLVWNGFEYEPKDTKDVVIGDKVPVAIRCDPSEITHSIKISDYLSNKFFVHE